MAWTVRFHLNLVLLHIALEPKERKTERQRERAEIRSNELTNKFKYNEFKITIITNDTALHLVFFGTVNITPLHLQTKEQNGKLKHSKEKQSQIQSDFIRNLKIHVNVI